jgi:hypothetical protein
MPRCTLRRAWPDAPDRADDFVICVDGEPSGRCYFTHVANRPAWLWTVYNSSDRGLEYTLAEAQAKFKRAIEATRGDQSAP